MKAFRDDEYLWWQVAEYTYDTFMIRTRAQGLIRTLDRYDRGRPTRPAPTFLGLFCRHSPLTTLSEPVQTRFSERLRHAP